MIGVSPATATQKNVKVMDITRRLPLCMAHKRRISITESQSSGVATWHDLADRTSNDEVDEKGRSS